MTSETDKVPVGSSVAFRVGQFFFVTGYIFYVVGMSSSYWVVRPTINMTALGVTSKTTLHYGIFSACLQINDAGDDGKCESPWKNLRYIDMHATKLVQALMVIACILFFVGLSLEIFQILPLNNYRNFVAQNRLMELFSGISAVVALVGIVVFAGEIKNKAERVIGQDEETTGWSFIMAVIGLCFSIVGTMTVTMFRDLPVPRPGEKGGSWLKY